MTPAAIIALPYFILALLSGACGVARRYQGSSSETWPVKRMPWRMLIMWPALAVAFMGVGIWLGLTWWLAFGIGTLPGLWAWTPGDINRFGLQKILPRWMWGPDGKIAEGISGGLGGIVAGGLILIAGAL